MCDAAQLMLRRSISVDPAPRSVLTSGMNRILGFADGGVCGATRLQRPAKGEDFYEVRGFGFNPGALRMLAYVPENLAPAAALVVVLHGCTQQAAGHARAAGWIALADRYGFAVIAPEQASSNNPNGCFNWFEPGDAARGMGEAASIHAMVQHMLRRRDLDPARVFVTGLSAGGAMTLVMLAAYPETFAAGAIVAGLPFGIATNVHEALIAMRGGYRLADRDLGRLVERAAPACAHKPRLAIWHGEADATVSSANAHVIARQWAAFHGLAGEPGEVRVRPGWTRSVWRGSDDEATIELNLLAGLGHGMPLAASGDKPIGQTAPYMLEAGVSSALEIARFWDIAPHETGAQAETWASPSASRRSAAPTSAALGEKVIASIAPHLSKDIQQVIARALASAGLMN